MVKCIIPRCHLQSAKSTAAGPKAVCRIVSCLPVTVSKQIHIYILLIISEQGLPGLQLNHHHPLLQVLG